ncbi:Uncharacterised protein [Klebsiella pneumoniae subsp. rhinoscleromatis]|nr:Uncharacterised protein [Klebsiella pneumoniae subsp. rhinoscleromatis]
MTFMVRQKGTESRVNTSPGIFRNMLQMTSFGAHSTPLEDASEQLEALEAYFENFA